MDDANDVVLVLLVDGDAGVRLAENVINVPCQIVLDIDHESIGPRHHDFAGNLVMKVHAAFDHGVFHIRQKMSRVQLVSFVLQLFLALFVIARETAF